MSGSCLTENILHYARIICDDETYIPKLYKEICETTFRKVYANRKKSFTVENNQNNTKLSTEYQKLENKKLDPRISWSIKGKYKSYKHNSKRCSLYVAQKMEIVDDPKEILSKKRLEVISQCHHRSKYELKTLLSNKKTGHHIIYKQLGAGIEEIYAVKIFQILRGTIRCILSLVKFKTFPAFLKMNSTIDIYYEFSTIFRATISMANFCLNTSQEITVYWCRWFYFPVRSI